MYDSTGAHGPLRGVAYLPDPFVLEHTLARMAPDFSVGWEAHHFVDLLRDMMEQTAYMRMALQAQRAEEDKYLVELDAAEADRQADIKRELWLVEKEKRVAAELAALKKRAEDGDEIALQEYQAAMTKMKQKATVAAAKAVKKKEKDKKRVEKAERKRQRELVRKGEEEAAAKQKEVDELNFLSENNPAKYDEVMAEVFEREKAELEEKEAKAAKRKRIKEAKQRKAKADKERKEKQAATNGGIEKPTGPPLMLF